MRTVRFNEGTKTVKSKRTPHCHLVEQQTPWGTMLPATTPGLGRVTRGWVQKDGQFGSRARMPPELSHLNRKDQMLSVSKSVCVIKCKQVRAQRHFEDGCEARGRMEGNLGLVKGDAFSVPG
jgi:hypothetical protein